MTLTYIFHSGFVLETEKCILVFDYWMDPCNIMSNFHHKMKRTYVFSSHFHEDHFNREIFDWRDNRHTYILSKDILKHRRAKKEEADVWLAKGGTWEDENIKVIATGSNDSGVSWIIEIEGKCIFHAGDLCNWYARFLAEEEVPNEIMSTEFGMINPVAEEKHYLGELKDIVRLWQEHSILHPVKNRSGEGLTFDIAMFPVDGRIGNGYTLGARQFIDRFRVEMFVPMHFVASGFESAWRMEPFCQEKRIPFWRIGKEGENISFIDNLTIRKSTIADIPRMREIFGRARRFMVETGNPNQWTNDYPSDEFLCADIESGDSYVCLSDDKIVATFLLRGGDDPTYSTIYDGAWLNDAPYATIHRIASNGTIKGILHTAMKFALLNYDNIRIDTHRDNAVMQNAVHKESFQYCGIIHCWNGEERMAYQYTKINNQDL